LLSPLFIGTADGNNCFLMIHYNCRYVVLTVRPKKVGRTTLRPGMWIIKSFEGDWRNWIDS
jgi:hypothetical protein